ncbi:hypothetical protein [Pararhodobacter marinus]|uniref:hypothetical protein n=1 Tax=Pararhodobacter marinus TaxID=2184063 RepID=UPI00351786EE
MIDETTWRLLPIRRSLFDLIEPQEFNRPAGGGAIPASLGDPLWTARVEFAPALPAAANHWRSALSRLRRPGQRIDAFDPFRNGPAADPGGILLDGATISIAALNADGVSLRLAGLPGRYTITPGDYLGVTVSGVPYLFRAVTGVTSFAGGYADFFEVEPWLPPEVTVGLAVTLVRPVMRGQVIEYQPGMRELDHVSGGFLTLQQVFD